MVSEEKICKMTKLAVFEEKNLEQVQNGGSYFLWDYVRSNVLKVIASYTAGYLILLILFGLYYIDSWSSAVRVEDISTFIMTVLAIYILVMIGCIFFGIVIYSQRYQRIDRVQKEYVQMLEELQQFGQESKEGTGA